MTNRQVQQLGVTILWLFFLAEVSMAATPMSSHPKPKDYDQWRAALDADAATAAESITAIDGFEVELLRSARPGEGSWIAMAFDPQRRLTISREDVGLVRLIIPDLPINPRYVPPHPPIPPEDDQQTDSIAEVDDQPSTEPREPLPHDPFLLRPVESTLKECRGLLYAYQALYANANNSKGFYRLQDRDDDGMFEDVQMLKATPGGVGHGRNDLTLGPDGLIYSIHGNDVKLPDDYTVGHSPYRHWAVDQLLPCEWNKYLFNAGATVPAGHVVRTDAEGNRWELVAGGMRNPYGIAFNDDGEMFTYDADMEWDAGAPWYRPTRVHHITSGADYGWRQGTGKWPAFYPDSLPATADIGLGSPTAVLFGKGAKFPAKYQQCLYVLEWAYGRILAVHLTPKGASYDAAWEVFLQGQPLNVTDAAIGPDGHLYFITGGRKTQSGLYRVKYTGDATETSHAAGSTEAADSLFHQRRMLEKFHGRVDAEAVEKAWPFLGSEDRFLRHAARVAIEAQPSNTWAEKALAESDPLAATTALLALVRAPFDDDIAVRLKQRLLKFDLNELTPPQRLIYLRTWQVALARKRIPLSGLREQVARHLNATYPTDDLQANRLLCELLVYCGDPTVVPKAVKLLDDPIPTPEKLHLLFTLRHMGEGWTAKSRETYFHWLRKARAFPGAHYIPRFVHYIEKDALSKLSPTQQAEMKAILAKEDAPLMVVSSKERPVVKEWKSIDFLFELDGLDEKRNLARGKEMFVAAQCAKCHRVGDVGKPIGPDLAQVRQRMSRRDVLTSLLSPSKVIGDKYRQTKFTTTAGKVITGTLIEEDDERVVIAADPTAPMKITTLALADIQAREPSPISPMPSGLLNTLTLEEILDLLAFLEASSERALPGGRE